MSNGILLYHGPSSLVPSENIIVVFVKDSDNTKTGNMHQVFILPAAVKPTTASRTGADVAVCGDCKHRRVNNNSCYVNRGFAPNGIWKTWNNHGYEHRPLKPSDVSAPIRIGADGDPAATPLRLVQDIIKLATFGHTAYTHQWKIALGLRPYAMASVDTEKEFRQARDLGWRTFRTRRDVTEPVQQGEVICPASAEGHYRETCSSCLACNGAPLGSKSLRKSSIVIISHGTEAKVNNAKMGARQLRLFVER